MLPGLPPFTTLNMLLTLTGFVGGIIIWNILAGHSGVWGRMQYDPNAVHRLLIRQMMFVVGSIAVLILLGNWIGGMVGSVLNWLLAAAGMIFWGYLGALALTALRGALLKR